jgi:hypothetical protein
MLPGPGLGRMRPGLVQEVHVTRDVLVSEFDGRFLRRRENFKFSDGSQ